LEADEQLRGDLRGSVTRRLQEWLRSRIALRLEPLLALRRAADARAGTKAALPAQARGLAYQLCEGLGSVDRERATLPPDESGARRALRPFGVTFARRSIFLPKLLRPDASSLLALLFGVNAQLARIPPPPQPGLTSFQADNETPVEFLSAAGFRVVGTRAIRLDMLDRIDETLDVAAASGATADYVTARLMSLLGCDRAALADVLANLGWQRVEVADLQSPASVWRRRDRSILARERSLRATDRRMSKISPSPFSPLASLVAAD
jgi:ATP-dependent RNA helicase SUPV3L1/SUV3